MKKLFLTIVSVMGLSLAPAVAVSAATTGCTSGCGSVLAAATTDCNVTTTGPESPASCEVTNDNTCTVDNENNIDVNNNNNQSTGSGDATTDGNTTVGDVTTGDSTANNDTNVDVSIDNGGCTPTTTTEDPGTTPAAGGQGEGAPAVLSASTTKVAALPDTGNGATVIAATLVSLAGVTALAAGRIVATRQ